MSAEIPTIEKPAEEEKSKREKPVNPEVLAYFEEKAKEQAGLMFKEVKEFEEAARGLAMEETKQGIFQDFRSKENRPFIKILGELKGGKKESALAYLEKEIEKRCPAGKIIREVGLEKSKKEKGSEQKIILESEALAIMRKTAEDIGAKCKEFGWNEEELLESVWPGKEPTTKEDLEFFKKLKDKVG